MCIFTSKHWYQQGIKMLLASGCECLIQVGFDIEETCWVWPVRILKEGGAEYGVTCRLSKQYLFNLRNEGS